MSKIDVSIIVATFNAGKFLKTALDSVKKQSYANWECIVVDGKSSDNTIDIVRLYEKDDSRFKHISEKDKGIYDAFNKGWRMAKGEWVYYLGADDALDENALKNLFEKEKKCDIVYGDIIFRNKRGLKYARSLPVNKLKGNMISHQSIFMRRDLIDRLGGFDLSYKVCADFDLFQRGLLVANGVMYEPCYIAVFEAGGASSGGYVFLKERFLLHKKYGGALLAISDILVETLKVLYRKMTK